MQDEVGDKNLSPKPPSIFYKDKGIYGPEFTINTTGNNMTAVGTQQEGLWKNAGANVSFSCCF